MPKPSSSKNAGFNLSQVDCEAFLKELKSLRREIDQNLGEDDIKHLKKIELWGRAFTVIGALTAPIFPNPVSMASLALGRSTRWTLMHHINHRGYDKVPGIPKKYTSEVFGKGRRRFLDWPDWLDAEAWAYEHNYLHHAHTAEVDDPDLVEHNMEQVRISKLPRPVLYWIIFMVSLNWRPTAYAPNALQVYKNKDRKGAELGDYDLARSLKALFDWDYWKTGIIPYSLLQFVLFPLLYLPLGLWSVFSAFCNSVGAEIIYNAFSYWVVTANHCGDDMVRYDSGPNSRTERKMRQIVSSVNYKTDNDWQGLYTMFLNYQIEHHIWPDVPMLKYKQYQPKVKALCEKYGVPYTQDSLFNRVKRTLKIMVGDTSMKRVENLAI